METLWRLTAQERTRMANSCKKSLLSMIAITPFIIRDVHGAAVRTLTNFYQMSVLLQELTRTEEQHTNEVLMDNLQLDESSVDRTHRFIKEYFWNALTRRIDARHLDQVVSDSKTGGKIRLSLCASWPIRSGAKIFSRDRKFESRPEPVAGAESRGVAAAGETHRRLRAQS